MLHDVSFHHLLLCRYDRCCWTPQQWELAIEITSLMVSDKSTLIHIFMSGWGLLSYIYSWVNDLLSYIYSWVDEVYSHTYIHEWMIYSHTYIHEWMRHIFMCWLALLMISLVLSIHSLRVRQRHIVFSLLNKLVFTSTMYSNHTFHTLGQPVLIVYDQLKNLENAAIFYQEYDSMCRHYPS